MFVRLCRKRCNIRAEKCTKRNKLVKSSQQLSPAIRKTRNLSHEIR